MVAVVQSAADDGTFGDCSTLLEVKKRVFAVDSTGAFGGRAQDSRLHLRMKPTCHSKKDSMLVGKVEAGSKLGHWFERHELAHV